MELILDKNDTRANIDVYNGILSSTFERRGVDPSSVLSWLASSDFYKAPASTRFHDSFFGGLLYHHLNVYNNMVDLLKLEKFKSLEYDIDSIALVALTHDWCKIGLYEEYLRNVKNEETGRWEKVPAYRRYNFQFPFGHGVSSMYLIQKFINLTIDEALAIRWHMGSYQVDEHEQSELQEACDNYPLVRMIQFADQLACTNY